MSLTPNKTKAIWLVRAGKYGEQEQLALENNIVTIGWNKLGNISDLQNKEELIELFELTYPNEKPKAIINKASQVWRFKNEIEIGDLVVLPLKQEPVIAVGKIISKYKFIDNLGTVIRHARTVEWITKDMPRNNLNQDLLYSLGAFMTVCRIQRNDAETRIPAAIQSFLDKASSSSNITLRKTGEETIDDKIETVDLETLGKDQIRSFISQQFAGHRLQDLVAAIFEVEGYATVVSPPGKDGGVDILAGKGMLGLEEPRICVQVKATSTPSGIDVVNSLLGVVASHGASYGLIVSMGGFTQDARKKAREQFFKVRLWDSNDLINATLRNYTKLSDEIQASLPLKQVWMLVDEDE
ncbi:restriction endonuclease [Priestia aryabhattai]|uniref:restriction endonuclease n=1 Tax=Priestia aryabhattai TaxID=412384 RepID=UPI001C8D39F4|nr:restriction endonuclease [Priestia aryabhattai]MBX9987165.1 restriction endonuclease [Priestia aryabhattai]